jgi:putative membrane protein
MIYTIFSGFSMSLADSVPGVSGGTLAYILGFYEQFISALRNLFHKNSAERKNNFFYLVKFGAGWVLGMGGSVLILSKVFESNIYFMSSMFLGLTLSAIPFIIHAERNVLKRHYGSLAFTLLGAVFVVLLTVIRSKLSGVSQIDFAQLGVLQYGYLVIAGLFAVSAMLLPGISGSTLLLIFGVYMPAVTAVKEVLHFHLNYLPGILSLAAGAVPGVILAAKFIRSALRKYRTQMIYLILGLMLGSLYTIAMGPTTLSTPRPPVDFGSFQLSAFVIGILVLVALEGIRICSQRSRAKRAAASDKAM